MKWYQFLLFLSADFVFVSWIFLEYQHLKLTLWITLPPKIHLIRQNPMNLKMIMMEVDRKIRNFDHYNARLQILVEDILTDDLIHFHIHKIITAIVT